MASTVSVNPVAYLLILAVAVFACVCMWKIFEKAGYSGWKSLIPFYNTYCLFQMTWGNGWLMLLCMIPFVNFVVLIMMYHKLSKAFGKGAGFTVGILFLSPIFLAMLAFGDATYTKPENA